LSLPEKKMLREILRQVVTESAAPALVVGDGLPPDLAD
jgi:hypothetical protein